MTQAEFSRLLSRKAIELLREMPDDVLESLAELIELAEIHECPKTAEYLILIRKMLSEDL